MRALVDEACRKAGRDPADARADGRALRRDARRAGRTRRATPRRPKAEAIPGDAETLAAALRAFAAEGIGHVQLVLDPITADSIRALAPALALFDA